jgi:D-alanine--poly(phosphoribitol) ligase subunit 1
VDILERIDRWAELAPRAIAHVSGDRRLTYGELRQRSGALAASLAEQSNNDFSPVAVLGHREPEMLIAFLGCAKAARAYIPIDPLLPRRRIDHILATAGAKLILTPNEVAARSASDAKAPIRRPNADDLFYILFTSGSTGEPKGVPITCGCLSHFLSWMIAEQRFAEFEETFLNQAPFSFDLSVMDLYCSLVTGGTLFSVGRDLIENPRLLYAALASAGLTTWVSTPSFAQLCLVDRKFDEKMLPQLRRFLFCGETLARETAERLRQRFPRAAIWNTYGPTEATVATTSIRIDDAILKKYAVLPVGRAMPGTEVFIATGDNSGSVDTTGEIVIAGPNVSPGYLGDPGSSPQRFFIHHGQRAFRTGDCGRFSDGLLFFEGRTDHQVKLNGYRIELGDIEGNLRALPGIHDAIVVPVVKNGRTTSLAAFVIPERHQEMPALTTMTQLRQSLGDRIPEYMMPRRFLFLDDMPMTPNGKADRARLATLL